MWSLVLVQLSYDIIYACPISKEHTKSTGTSWEFTENLQLHGIFPDHSKNETKKRTYDAD